MLLSWNPLINLQVPSFFYSLFYRKKQWPSSLITTKEEGAPVLCFLLTHSTLSLQGMVELLHAATGSEFSFSGMHSQSSLCI